MSMGNLAYARIHYQSFCRSARHILQIIGSHQSPDTGWAYLAYATIAFEVSLSVRRVIQLVALLEAANVLEVRRGHGRGHVNFYRILREEDGCIHGQGLLDTGGELPRLAQRHRDACPYNP